MKCVCCLAYASRTRCCPVHSADLLSSYKSIKLEACRVTRSVFNSASILIIACRVIAKRTLFRNKDTRCHIFRLGVVDYLFNAHAVGRGVCTAGVLAICSSSRLLHTAWLARACRCVSLCSTVRCVLCRVLCCVLHKDVRDAQLQHDCQAGTQPVALDGGKHLGCKAQTQQQQQQSQRIKKGE